MYKIKRRGKTLAYQMLVCPRTINRGGLIMKNARIENAFDFLAAAVQAENRFYYKHHGKFQNRRSYDTSTTASPSTFDPDVLNRFLEEYANKIKRTTERPQEDEPKLKPQGLLADIAGNSDSELLPAETTLNDTNKRQKYYSANAHGDERNNGWVTLDAIPWSKSKISKWQANPTSQRPWPDSKPGSYGNKPWNSEFPSRPASYESNKPPPSWPSYSHQVETYVSEPNGWHDRNDFPSYNKYPRPNHHDDYYDRPHFSQYQYPSQSSGEAGHPQNYPTSGDGHWVLLSTNRGYSKTRQRSLKLDKIVEANEAEKKRHQPNAANEEEYVPAVTSKRQVRSVRLTVLPSLNGTNTTTSHGGLLEVEKTFKTVDQSQREYEQKKKLGLLANPGNSPIVVNGKPGLHGVGLSPGSAVLAAVGAGMLPATMAMMIPMMLGRKKRHIHFQDEDIRLTRISPELLLRRITANSEI
ncbi:unnamed protein product [Trichogramma brassicae]|uniref:Uncharacterized protein n=1 Tax=Trichogramma brassicae TaxID=86971 RepID=A0A6H5J8T0_9HYME|nr:unnamed protein product [Trichogramma brassicae]